MSQAEMLPVSGGWDVILGTMVVLVLATMCSVALCVWLSGPALLRAICRVEVLLSGGLIALSLSSSSGGTPVTAAAPLLLPVLWEAVQTQTLRALHTHTGRPSPLPERATGRLALVFDLIAPFLPVTAILQTLLPSTQIHYASLAYRLCALRDGISVVETVRVLLWMGMQHVYAELWWDIPAPVRAPGNGRADRELVVLVCLAADTLLASVAHLTGAGRNSGVATRLLPVMGSLTRLWYHAAACGLWVYGGDGGGGGAQSAAQWWTLLGPTFTHNVLLQWLIYLVCMRAAETHERILATLGEAPADEGEVAAVMRALLGLKGGRSASDTRRSLEEEKRKKGREAAGGAPAPLSPLVRTRTIRVAPYRVEINPCCTPLLP